MYKSAIEYPSHHWEPAYDEKYYNNLGIICIVYKVSSGSGSSAGASAGGLTDSQCIYRLWSPDVKDLISTGTTIDEAKTDFWFHVMNRIYNREGGIYLINSNIQQCDRQQTTTILKKIHKDSIIESLPEPEVVLIQPTIISRN